MLMNEQKNAVVNQKFGIALMWTTFLFFFCMASIVVFFFVGLLFGLFSPEVYSNIQLIPKGGPVFAILKSSFASVIALLVVVMLRYSAGPIEYEAAGMKFKGASGPVVLWIFCFLALSAGISFMS